MSGMYESRWHATRKLFLPILGGTIFWIALLWVVSR